MTDDSSIATVVSRLERLESVRSIATDPSSSRSDIGAVLDGLISDARDECVEFVGGSWPRKASGEAFWAVTEKDGQLRPWIPTVEQLLAMRSRAGQPVVERGV